MTEAKQDKKLDTLEKVAAGVSVAVLASGVIYWVVQVFGVIEMLQLAYG